MNVRHAIWAVVAGVFLAGGASAQEAQTSPDTAQGPTTPTAQQPATQTPTAQQPTTRAPAAQRPTTQAPVAQQPATQAPTTQRPVAAQEQEEVEPGLSPEEAAESDIVAEVVMEGRVAKVKKDGGLCVYDEEGNTYDLLVMKDTEVLGSGGKKASLKSLKEGTPVRVSFDYVKGAFVATEVRKLPSSQ